MCSWWAGLPQPGQPAPGQRTHQLRRGSNGLEGKAPCAPGRVSLVHLGAETRSALPAAGTGRSQVRTTGGFRFAGLSAVPGLSSEQSQPEARTPPSRWLQLQHCRQGQTRQRRRAVPSARCRTAPGTERRAALPPPLARTRALGPRRRAVSASGGSCCRAAEPLRAGPSHRRAEHREADSLLPS